MPHLGYVAHRHFVIIVRTVTASKRMKMNLLAREQQVEYSICFVVQ